MKNRYIFFKRLFPEFIIIFKKDNNNLVSFNYDAKLIKLKDNINHIIIDKENNLEIIKVVNNNYYKLLIKTFLLDIINLLK